MGYSHSHCTALTPTGHVILERASRTFMSGEDDGPLVEYLDPITVDESLTTKERLQMIGFVEVWASDDRICFSVPKNLTNGNVELTVRFPFGPQANEGARKNLTEATVWTIIGRREEHMSIFMPVEGVGKNGAWLVMENGNEVSPTLTDGVVSAQFDRLLTGLSEKGITTPVSEDTTIFHNGNVLLMRYGEVDTSTIQ